MQLLWGLQDGCFRTAIRLWSGCPIQSPWCDSDLSIIQLYFLVYISTFLVTKLHRWRHLFWGGFFEGFFKGDNLLKTFEKQKLNIPFMFWKETGKHVRLQRNVMWCVSLAGGASAHSYGVINIIRIQRALNVETKSPWLHFVACEKPKAREGGNSSELLAELPAEIWTSSVWSPGITSVWFSSKAFWDSRTSAVLDASEIWQYKQGHCPSRRC